MEYSAIPTTMQVARFGGNGTIGFEARPVPSPGERELLIRVKANALCGSERGQWLNGSERTPGHEIVGTVASVGSLTSTPVGTPGVVFLMVYCNQCRSCAQGFTNQCLAKQGDIGFNRDGGYAPYVLVPEHIFFPVDPDLPLTEATLLLDIMGTGGHAIARARQMHSDIQSVVITGAGPMGLGVLAMAKILLGADIPVVVADVIPYRLQLATRLGALTINLLDQAMADGLVDLGFPKADVAVDTSGKADARQACLGSLAQRGVLVCVGHGETVQLNVSQDLIAPERAVLGSEYFSFGELRGNLKLLRANRSYLAQIITHRFALAQLADAFSMFFDGATGKVVIEQ